MRRHTVSNCSGVIKAGVRFVPGQKEQARLHTFVISIYTRESFIAVPLFSFIYSITKKYRKVKDNCAFSGAERKENIFSSLHLFFVLQYDIM
jgi:hypothetical protein